MKKFVLPVTAALVLGLLAGAGWLGIPGFGGDSVRTSIALEPHQSERGKCISRTRHRRIKAKRRWFVGWEIVKQRCQLAGGGVVQLRFAAGSPLNVDRPEEQNGWIPAIVRQNADLINYPYKVWAHFPAQPEQDYPLEDPDLEIVF